MALKERDVEKYLVERVKALGGEVRKVKWVGRDGAPDRVVMLPHDRRLSGQPAQHLPIWIELKKPGGAAAFPKNAHERKQAREHTRMRNMGQRVEVIDDFEGVDEVLT